MWATRMSNESSQKRHPKPPFWWAMGPVDLPPRRPNDDLFKPLGQKDIIGAINCI